MHVCNTSSREAEAGGLRIQGQSGLSTKYQGSLSYGTDSYISKQAKSHGHIIRFEKIHKVKDIQYTHVQHKDVLFHE
jgi:hypothetical protein